MTMHKVTLKSREIFRGKDAIACHSWLAAQHPEMTVSTAVFLGFRIEKLAVDIQTCSN